MLNLRVPKMNPQSYWDEKWRNSPQLRVNDYAVSCQEIMKSGGPKKILDIGCGCGSDTLYFARQGHLVTAIDISPYSIEQLKHSAQIEKLHIDSIIGDISQIHLPEDSFDIVYAHLSLHYFGNEDTENIFNKIYKSLHPSGIFFIKCKSVDDPIYGTGHLIEQDAYQSDHIRHFFSQEYLYTKMASAGFGEIDVIKSDGIHRKEISYFTEGIGRKHG